MGSCGRLDRKPKFTAPGCRELCCAANDAAEAAACLAMRALIMCAGSGGGGGRGRGALEEAAAGGEGSRGSSGGGGGNAVDGLSSEPHQFLLHLVLSGSFSNNSITSCIATF